eukprot:CAMPEP_0177656140 /NCGR_PEP_ID=MMETSP0447-20121125/15384_1 /TAXON_ID=0 /ORGANISM="Stygamoeba regulata, Strain BSH-02190019" /LENGTH=542 /DNA_ID=CAMNT_0019160191 /DNA_START=32 /DNA_END=1660 /DNA_ORIENTATION=+
MAASLAESGDRRSAVPFKYVNEDAIDHALTCTLVCMEPLFEPVVTSCCGSYLCKQCATPCDRCPKCRCQPFEFKDCIGARERLLQNQLAVLKVFCMNQESGCSWTGERGNRDAHVTGCSFFACTNQHAGCSWAGKRADVTSHLDNQCAYHACSNASRGCKHRGRRQMQKHLHACDFAVVSCKYRDCDWSGLRKDSVAHEHLCAKTSDFAIVSCINVPCQWSGPRYEHTATHARRCPHLPLEARITVLEELFEERLRAHHNELVQTIDDAILQARWISVHFPTHRAGGGKRPHFRNFDFSTYSLQGANLAGFDLSTSRFPKKLDRVTFSGSRLPGIDLTGTTFEHCSFVNVSANGAIFTECTFEECDFSGATLQKSIFAKASINGTKFVKAQLQHANFDGARIAAVGEFQSISHTYRSGKRCDFTDATLTNASFRHAIFSSGVSLSGSILEDVDFTDADLRYVSFVHIASLRDAILTGARMLGTSFRTCDLLQATVDEEFAHQVAMAQRTLGPYATSRTYTGSGNMISLTGRADQAAAPTSFW